MHDTTCGWEYRRFGSVKNYIHDDTVKFNHILHTKLGMSVHIDHTFAGTCLKGRFQNHPEGGGFDFFRGEGLDHLQQFDRKRQYPI